MDPIVIQTDEEFENILMKSHETPVFLLKISPICPISFSAQNQFKTFLEELPVSVLRAFTIDVIKCRPVSLNIAEKTGVAHQSPQALLFYCGSCVWHDSHGALTTSAFQTSLNQLIAKN